ncbi:putative oxidoreductase [Hypoxylon sp. FL1284]|nr:putative oxidoreductase [Hypoxylon sp. FL1284]
MPHKEEEYSEFTPDLYPEFPDEYPSVELQTISLPKLLAGDAGERDRVFDACSGRGFFYLDLGGCADGDAIMTGADEIARLGSRVFELPLDDKMQYKQGKQLFGYKFAGSSVADKYGARDTAEFFNISKNDMIVPDDQMRRPWPAQILDAKPLLSGYVRSAHAVGLAVLAVLADKMGVESAEFARRHRIEEPSGDHIRITRGPPKLKKDALEIQTPSHTDSGTTRESEEIQTPSHTDFGTITILMNWLGGLQVYSESARRAQLSDGQPDEPGTWLWVKPRRGCAIVNLGDAAMRFSGGALHAGRHRVLPAPGAQGEWPRYSIVYFVRPEDSCPMRRFDGAGVPGSPEDDDNGEVLTATEWIYRQSSALGNKLD